MAVLQWWCKCRREFPSGCRTTQAARPCGSVSKSIFAGGLADVLGQQRQNFRSRSSNNPDLLRNNRRARNRRPGSGRCFFSATAMNHARSSAEFLRCQRRAGDAVETDGIPVIRAGACHQNSLPGPFAAARYGAKMRRSRFSWIKLPRRTRQPVAEQITSPLPVHAES